MSARVPKVGIVLVTFNRSDLTAECLASLARVTYPNYILILIDNHSTDDTIAVVRACAPHVVLIENEENFGFAGGNNVGIHRALDEGCDYVLLLNNDTRVAPTFLQELIDVCEQDPAVGMAGPRILYADSDTHAWFAGGVFNWQAGNTIRLESDETDPSLLPRPTDYVVGTALCVKRSVVERIGLLDSRYFMYYEEVDWCVRARAAGYRLMYVPRSVIWHHVSASSGLNSPMTTYYMTRNRFLCMGKNLRGYQRARALASAATGEVRTLLAYSLKPRYRDRRPDRDARWRALRDVLRGKWGRM